MAIRLNAEQKFIEEIFSGKIEYVIPPYQRSYSWNEEQCETLFEDLKNAFLKDKEQGYFLGNIVLAKSINERNIREVIDGQQRLITLILLSKALSIHLPKNIDLISVIWIKDTEGERIKERLITKVFEDKDAKYLKEVIENETINVQIRRSDNNFRKNFYYFYNKLQDFAEFNNLQDFAEFILSYVSLLPIESEDVDHQNARRKALKIFETINNRGLILSNADIFKSELYSMALNKLEDIEFINKWKELDQKCDELQFPIDRVFKIYSYEIRGEKGIKSSEIGLRDFFDKKNTISPFNFKNYNEIMDDLNNILNSIEFFNEVIQLLEHNTLYNELSKWFQLVDIYTNNFPKDLLIVYISQKNKFNYSINEMIDFSKSLVRYCYFHGATTRIKYYIYDLTINVMTNSPTSFYPDKDLNKDYTYFGMLYKSYALLLSYLHPDQKAVSKYQIKKLKDFLNFNHKDYSIFDSIGNNIPIDISKKEFLNNDIKSEFHDLNFIKNNKDNWNADFHERWKEELKERLNIFFRKQNENS